MKINTKLLHGVNTDQKAYGATLPPVFFSNAYEQDSAEQLEKVFHNKAFGYSYARINNPTTDAFERRITELEEGIGSVAASSGMAAIFNALMVFLESGDEILASAGIFGGTIGLFQDLEAFGIRIRYLEYVTAETVRTAVSERTKAVFFEVVGNPRLDVTDVKAVAEEAHRHGIVCIVDNTATTPWMIRPLTLGADIVVQSSSKYINGSSNSISGIITDSGRFRWDPERYPQMEAYRNMGPFGYIAKLRGTLFRNTGACLPAMSSFFNCLGLETMGLRMERICENAQRLAEFLRQNKNVVHVNYPGLESSPWHELAERQFHGSFGGLLTIRLGTKERAYQFMNALKIPLKVSNIGDTKTLVICPGPTIYAHSSEEEKRLAGVTEDLVRVSVGIEDVEDLIEDFSQALDSLY